MQKYFDDGMINQNGYVPIENRKKVFKNEKENRKSEVYGRSRGFS